MQVRRFEPGGHAGAIMGQEPEAGAVAFAGAQENFPGGEGIELDHPPPGREPAMLCHLGPRHDRDPGPASAANGPGVIEPGRAAAGNTGFSAPALGIDQGAALSDPH